MAQSDHDRPEDQSMQGLPTRQNRAPQFNRANRMCRCGCGCGCDTSSNESEGGSDESSECACGGENLFETPSIERLSLDSESTSNQPLPQVIGGGGDNQYVRTRYGVIIITAGEFQYPTVPLSQEEHEVHIVPPCNVRNRLASPNALSRSVLTESQLSTHRSMTSSSIRSRPIGSIALQGLGGWNEHLHPNYFCRAPLVLTAGAPPRQPNPSPTQWWPLSSDQSVVDSYSSRIADEDLHG